jgi:hypothetical protein
VEITLFYKGFLIRERGMGHVYRACRAYPSWSGPVMRTSVVNLREFQIDDFRLQIEVPMALRPVLNLQFEIINLKFPPSKLIGIEGQSRRGMP